MVWAAIGTRYRNSDLIIMEGDPQARRTGFSANSYILALEDGLLPIYEGQVFQQDNAPIHRATITSEWLQNHWINILQNWPPYSPDLNPIEHLWPRLKEALYELEDFDQNLEPKKQLQKMEELLPVAWSRIPSRVFRACLESMPDRLQAVIDAEGWQTKY